MPDRLAFTDEILESYALGRFRVYIVYGEGGIGKSTYVYYSTRDVSVSQDPWRFKEFMVFTPSEFVTLGTKMLNRQARLNPIWWEDAGYWLNRYLWHMPDVQEALRFLNVARTITPALIITTSSPAMLLSRITDMEGIRMIRLMPRSDEQHPNWVRAKGYKNIIMPNGKRFIRTVWEDDFINKMPNDVFQWYEPVRVNYARIALDNLREAVHRRYGDKAMEIVSPRLEPSTISILPPSSS